MGEKTTPEIHVLTRHKSDLKKNIYIHYICKYLCKFYMHSIRFIQKKIDYSTLVQRNMTSCFLKLHVEKYIFLKQTAADACL